ncbi:hypothetical protein [Pseudomonas multiresinivorans]|uniref:Uncharacterized protein n=1 Tax=Pseudomonas multiresinivorans TaxID=95301 RepID=A0A7Z3BMU2_9PSED|nr:hypothetical protein G4G71_18395 [Pseudomonas multiresinivorans]
MVAPATQPATLPASAPRKAPAIQLSAMPGGPPRDPKLAPASPPANAPEKPLLAPPMAPTTLPILLPKSRVTTFADRQAGQIIKVLLPVSPYVRISEGSLGNLHFGDVGLKFFRSRADLCELKVRRLCSERSVLRGNEVGDFVGDIMFYFLKYV